MRSFLVVALALMLAPNVGRAQDQTLADIRQELSVLYVEVQRLKRELSTTGAATIAVGGNTPLERIDAIEMELQRLTSKTEELEHKIDRVATVGGNQIGDLEFRLCELEADCDLGSLSDGTTLGGVEVTSGGGGGVITDSGSGDAINDGSELAIGEQADFDRAKLALDDGNFADAAAQFAQFTETYPGGPLSAEAYFLRGGALEKLGDIRPAARAYLDSFSTAPSGPMAPDALYKVGTTLGALGQNVEACQMLSQVGVRFPNSGANLDASSAMRNLGCS